jgi:hypothetical protein
MEYDWLPEDERGFYASCVHGLRLRGWSRSDAEGEAMDRLLTLRDRKANASPSTAAQPNQ